MQSGRGKQIRIRDLHHTHVSFFTYIRFAPLVISERLGHENVSTTLGIYSHLYQVSKTKLQTN